MLNSWKGGGTCLMFWCSLLFFSAFIRWTLAQCFHQPNPVVDPQDMRLSETWSLCSRAHSQWGEKHRNRGIFNAGDAIMAYVRVSLLFLNRIFKILLKMTENNTVSSGFRSGSLQMNICFVNKMIDSNCIICFINQLCNTVSFFW